MHTTSLTLLSRLKAGGSKTDWDRLVALYTPLLFFWANRAGLQNSDAADLVQNVLCLLIQKLPEFKYQKGGSFRGWLCKVTQNKLIDFRRQRRALATEADLERQVVPIADDAQIEISEQEYRQLLVARALVIMQDSFEDRTWRACWEMIMHDKSAKQVAAELGLSEGAAYVAKSRVLRKLREELTELLD